MEKFVFLAVFNHNSVNCFFFFSLSTDNLTGSLAFISMLHTNANTSEQTLTSMNVEDFGVSDHLRPALNLAPVVAHHC